MFVFPAFRGRRFAGINLVMFQNVFKILTTEVSACRSFANHTPFVRTVVQTSVSSRSLSTNVDEASKRPFDTTLLEFLVCPLSKMQLRYDEGKSELINEELGIAYPIINGIPNMIPQDARLIEKVTDKAADTHQE